MRELCSLPSETGWVEFKENNAQPEAIGEYVSALSNTAALEGKACGYIMWGIRDATHALVGTTFKPAGAKIGNENLENWLRRLLNPKLHFRLFELTIDEKPIVLLEIPRASGAPVQFQGIEYIRVGSYLKKLKEHPEFERELWRMFDKTPFEEGLAAEHVDGQEVLRVLDYPRYFELLESPLPDGVDRILERLADERMVVRDDAGQWNITNLGAVLFAKDLEMFERLARKAVRVVIYKGKGRVETFREQPGRKGYASGFEGLIAYMNALLPRNEVLGKAFRKEVPMFPETAIRELVANALIHQDFSMTGAGPLVEVFADRMEITNPGDPLVSTQRFLDTPPRSRNEALASFMRRVGICEERGSGIDKVVFETEFYQLPAPLFEVVESQTRAVLFAHKPFNDMSAQDRLRACYLHACLKYASREFMTNMSLRARFGLDEDKRAVLSRIIREAMDAKLIRPAEEGVRKYLPAWA